MPRIRTLIAALFALIPLGLVLAPGAAHAEKRIALVIGNAGYQAGALTTPANDAGLIAQTLQAAGFDVVGARDLDQDSLRHAFRDFVEKATSSGPDTVAFVYVSGYGLQLEGENYFVPIDGRIARDSEIPAEALRISDYSRPLAALKLKAGIVVLDAARANPFAKSGPPLAGGLALVEPEPGLLIAFNAAPGTVAPEGQGPYGPYAQALAEMLREGGLPLTGVFDRARLRVNDMTAGAEVPWHASKVQASLVFFERAADAPPPAVSIEESAALRSRPIRDLGAQDAYVLALERDTIEGYSDFLAAYPADPMATRVRAMVAARREAITWRRTRVVDTPPAYWSYLRRYPEGPHAGDAHRRLAYLAAAFEPPPRFTALAYDVLPPPPEEIVYIRRPILVFDDPVFGFAPPPPAPIIFLAPPPPEFVVLASPPPPIGIFVLPMPIYRPVPVWVRPPQYVAAPPANNVIFNNVHNTVVVNNVTNTVTVTNQSGQTSTLAPPAQPAAAAPAQGGPAGAPARAPIAAIGPSLPPSVAQKAVTLQNQNPQGAAGTPPTGSAPATKPAPGQALPGMQGQPLPAAATPGTGTPVPGTGRPGGPPGGQPAKPASPSAAVTPGTSSPTPPAGGATPATASPPPPTGAGAKKPAKLTPPGSLPAPTGSGAQPSSPPPAASPSAVATPGTSSPTPPAGGATPATASPPPPTGGGVKKPPPAAKLTPPGSLPAPTGSGAQPSSPPPAANLPPPSTPAKPALAPSSIPPAGAAKPSSPAAKLAPPPAAPKPPAPPPAAVARPAAPPPPPARVVTPAPPPPPPPKPPAPAMAPAAAAARPAAPAPAPKGCPPGKTAAVVNGQPVCK
jgi:uncharacterized caspase-like protein